jgi:hypothetical protein
MGKGSNPLHEITFVGHPVTTKSLRTELLDEGFSPRSPTARSRSDGSTPIRDGRTPRSAGRRGAGTSLGPHVELRGFGEEVAPNVDAMPLYLEDAVAPGGTLSYPENP